MDGFSPARLLHTIPGQGAPPPRTLLAKEPRSNPIVCDRVCLWLWPPSPAPASPVYLSLAVRPLVDPARRAVSVFPAAGHTPSKLLTTLDITLLAASSLLLTIITTTTPPLPRRLNALLSQPDPSSSPTSPTPPGTPATPSSCIFRIPPGPGWLFFFFFFLLLFSRFLSLGVGDHSAFLLLVFSSLPISNLALSRAREATDRDQQPDLTVNQSTAYLPLRPSIRPSPVLCDQRTKAATFLNFLPFRISRPASRSPSRLAHHPILIFFSAIKTPLLAFAPTTTTAKQNKHTTPHARRDHDRGFGYTPLPGQPAQGW